MMKRGISTKERSEIIRATLVGIPAVAVALSLREGLLEYLPDLSDWKTQLLFFSILLFVVYYLTDKK